MHDLASQLAEARRLASAGRVDQAADAAPRIGAAAIALARADARVGRPVPALAVEGAEFAVWVLIAAGRTAHACPLGLEAVDAGVRSEGLVGNLAAALVFEGRNADAVPLLQAQLALQPASVPLRTNLLGALMRLGRDREALQLASGAFAPGSGLAIADAPDLANNYAQVLHRTGRTTQALRVLADVLTRHPTHASALASRAPMTHYAATDPGTTLDAARALAASIAAAAPKSRAPVRYRGTLDPHRRLRLGLLSSDLRQHSVAYFTLPLLTHLDRERLELFVYDAKPRDDAMARRLRAAAGETQGRAVWRGVEHLSDPALAGQIHADAIDVLVELNGLTDGHRQPALAPRPAPVQLSYLGYAGTTGAPWIDGRLVDHLTDPPWADAFATERLRRFDGPFLAYAPPDDLPDVPPDARPAPPGEPLVFGCSAQIVKHSDAAVDLWARVLRGVPDSTLWLKAPGLDDDATRTHALERFARLGIAPQRLRLTPSIPDQREHLLSYARVDAVIDTFPYHGTTTTCEALMMGTPVVALVGSTHASRVDLSILSALGLDDLVAHSPEHLVAIAQRLAADRARRTELRATLRARFTASALGDHAGFARRFETLVRQAWIDHCARATRAATPIPAPPGGITDAGSGSQVRFIGL